MVESMHTARDCVVNGSTNAGTETSPPNASSFPVDRQRKVGKAGTIRAVVVVTATPQGTVVAATRAPNLICRQIAAQYRSATLCDIVTPEIGGLNAEQLIVQARRMLRIREGIEQPTELPSAAVVRALRFARTADAISRTVKRKRNSARKIRLNFVRAALCWQT